MIWVGLAYDNVPMKLSCKVTLSMLALEILTMF